MLPFRHSHLLPGALSNVYVSGVSSSGSSGEGWYSVPPQPRYKSAWSPLPNTFAHIPQTNQEFQPDRRGGDLTAFAARRVPDKFPVLIFINPKRGSIKGGDEAFLIVDDLPQTAVVYARFGSNIVPTVSSLNGPDSVERNECTDTSSLVSH
jgi:hypothetical protein